MKWEEMAENHMFHFSQMNSIVEDTERKLESLEEQYSYYVQARYDEATGKLTLYYPGVENQVINKVLNEEALVKILESYKEERSRYLKALLQLEPFQVELLKKCYISPIPLQEQMEGYPSPEKFHRARRRALLRFYRFYLMQRKEMQREKQIKMKRETMERYGLTWSNSLYKVG